MPFEPIYEPSNNGDELPWLNEYLISIGETSIPMEDAVHLSEVIIGPKGLLLLTKTFKAFAFIKSKGYEYLVEYFNKVHTGTVFIYSVGKKPAIAIDRDMGDTVFLDLGGRYQQTEITNLPSTHPIRVEFETGHPPTPKNRKSRP